MTREEMEKRIEALEGALRELKAPHHTVGVAGPCHCPFCTIIDRALLAAAPLAQAQADECPRGGSHSWAGEVDDEIPTGRIKCIRCGEWRAGIYCAKHDGPISACACPAPAPAPETKE